MAQKINRSATPSTFRCMGTGCKAVHTVGVWAAAHMSEPLGHTCKECGAEHTLINWSVTRHRDGKGE